MPKYRLDFETEVGVLTLYLIGFEIALISELYLVNKTTPMKLARRYGFEPRQHGGCRWN